LLLLLLLLRRTATLNAILLQQSFVGWWERDLCQSISHWCNDN